MPLIHHYSTDLKAANIKSSSGGRPRESIIGSAYLPYDDVPHILENGEAGDGLLEFTPSLALVQDRITPPGEVRTPTILLNLYSST